MEFCIDAVAWNPAFQMTYKGVRLQFHGKVSVISHEGDGDIYIYISISFKGMLKVLLNEVS